MVVRFHADSPDAAEVLGSRAKDESSIQAQLTSLQS